MVASDSFTNNIGCLIFIFAFVVSFGTYDFRNHTICMVNPLMERLCGISFDHPQRNSRFGRQCNAYKDGKDASPCHRNSCDPRCDNLHRRIHDSTRRVTITILQCARSFRFSLDRLGISFGCRDLGFCFMGNASDYNSAFKITQEYCPFF